MAILHDWPTLKVNIVVNDVPLEEYPIHGLDLPKTVARYIPASSGADFTIKYAFTRPFPADRPVSIGIKIDGYPVDEPFHHGRDLFEKEGYTCSGAMLKAGLRWYERKFKFAEISIEEGNLDPVSEELTHALDSVGTIELSFWFCENASRNVVPKIPPKKLNHLGVVPEKAVKGESISHQACLGQPEASSSVTYYDADYAEEEPFATFIYKYRSLKALKSLYVIPRTPTPEPLEDRDIEGMNPRELKVALRRLRQHQFAQQRIKREREREGSPETVYGDDDEDEIVYIGTKRRRLCLPSEQDVVIDLGAEDEEESQEFFDVESN
ncbi:hypothetical protein BDV96DRAFT_685220 [Lophiotrema nucula]|uniref:DUF7918 domain-containing protein n=1 Tax=Lophiotrema nucula TaxID=690887 RepID=A0A6A5ZEJ2_9PLEO|nr:hypothetical protein BDV96DRAFT_685220 [Lophiotrema nucula]